MPDKWLIVSVLWSITAVVAYCTWFVLNTKYKMSKHIKENNLNPKSNLEYYEIYKKVI